jgi:hypothetical protein
VLFRVPTCPDLHSPFLVDLPHSALGGCFGLNRYLNGAISGNASLKSCEKEASFAQVFPVAGCRLL